MKYGAIIYPNLYFGFNFDERFGRHQPIESHEGIVEESIRALESSVCFTLAVASPDLYPELPPYSYNPKRMLRINKYLAQTVMPLHARNRNKRSRKDIVDLPFEVEKIVDDIAEINHPVAQLVSQLYFDYGNSIGQSSVVDLTVDIVKLTNWNDLHSRIVSVVNAWRGDE